MKDVRTQDTRAWHDGTRTTQRSDQRSESRYSAAGGTREDQPGSEDGRSVEDANSWKERKRTEKDIQSLASKQKARQLLGDHRPCLGPLMDDLPPFCSGVVPSGLGPMQPLSKPHPWWHHLKQGKHIVFF